jgi:hypothetical protein
MVQRMRTFARAQHVVSTIICWCSHSSRAGGASARKKKGEFFAEQALQSAHEPYRHTGTLPAPQWYCRRRASFPRLIESLVPQCWRDVIVAGRSRKSSTGFGTPAIVSSRVSESARPTPDHRLHAAEEVVFLRATPQPKRFRVARQSDLIGQPRQLVSFRREAQRTGARLRPSACAR